MSGRAVLAAAAVGLLLGCSPTAPEATPPSVPTSPARPSHSPSTAVPATPPASQRPAAGVLDAADLAAFRRTFGADAALAVAGLDGSSPLATPHEGAPYAWSTVKVVIVAQTLLDAGGPAGLSDEQRTLIRRALSASDNEAAAQLHEQIMARHGGLQGAAEQMQRLLRRGGDDHTTVSTHGRADFSTYGQTLWPPRDQVRFLAALARGCMLDEPASDFLLAELDEVVPDQRWGLGLVDSPAFKGGWGPDPDGHYLVRQFGLVRAADGRLFAAALQARPGDGTFESGKAELGRMATWLSDRVRTAPAPEPCV